MSFQDASPLILVARWQWILAVLWLCLLAEPSSSHCLLHCLRCWERSWFCTLMSCASHPLCGVETNVELFWKGKGICGGKVQTLLGRVTLASCCFWVLFILDQFYHLSFQSWSKRSRKRSSKRFHGLWGIKFLMCVHKLSFDKYLISSTTVVCKFYCFVLSEVLSYFSHCRCV